MGEDSFLVTKGFDAMKAAIARKAERVLERLADGEAELALEELEHLRGSDPPPTQTARAARRAKRGRSARSG